MAKSSQLLVLFCITTIASIASSIFVPDPKIRITNPSDNYHFVFHEHISPIARKHHINQFSNTLTGGNTIIRYFEIGSFAGYTVHVADPEAFSSVSVQLSNPAIKYVSRETVVRAMREDQCLLQKEATWGLNRVGEREIDYNGHYMHKEGGGINTVAYIVDTGIYIQHQDFDGRAEWGGNFARDGKDTDCNGHGTHVAGTVGGVTYGVAKNVTLVAIKVLDCEGYGSSGNIIEGIAWAVQDAKKRKRPAVANMSLGTVGGRDRTLEDAVSAAIKEGVTFSVAAGNSNEDACKSSPSSVLEAITVGATEQYDHRASFSNFGKCVDIFAPGYSITSTWIGNNAAIKTISGTSMASPHVCGATALYVSENPTATPADVKQFLLKEGTKGSITMDCSSWDFGCTDSPNELLYVECASK